MSIGSGKRATRIGSTVIEGVEPQLDDARHAIKRRLGDPIRVRADVFKEGHDVLVAVTRWRQVMPAAEAGDWVEVPMAALGNDRWEATFRPPRIGRFQFTIEAWPDLFRTWVSELERKVGARRDVKSELLEGAQLLEDVAGRAESVSKEDARRAKEAAEALRGTSQQEAVARAVDPGLVLLASRYPDRTIATRYDREPEILVERERAEAGAWYELFPRSARGDGKTHGSFRDVEAQLPEIAGMGFDVLYLPPIHPIGRTARKGKNNTLNAQPDDVGSPWAIGASEGGHKSIHPELGTIEDFVHLVKAAESHGIEIALDLAYQCSPDHPYVREHPEWFNQRPDGTIKTAENPPKRYEDIVNFDFLGPAREALWKELESVVLYWVSHGVKIFRVDNPHTKPLAFWAWLMRRIHDAHPEVIFLSEAFTRPKVMKALAKVGFNQSYTYFTWRNSKAELEEYLGEITRPPVSDYFKGNLWPNTPDILPEALQRGGPPAFRLRYALAATLSSSFGIYSSYELCENPPFHPGGEEYRDSEKYELKAWDPMRPGNIRDWIHKINAIRKEQPALRRYSNLSFHFTDNDQVIFYLKSPTPGTDELPVLVAVSLDPFAQQTAVLDLPLAALNLAHDEPYQVHEKLEDTRATWQGPHAQITLTPERPAAIWTVHRFKRRENEFDYFG